MKNVITKQKSPRVIVYGLFPADFYSQLIESKYQHAYFPSLLRPDDFRLFSDANGGSKTGFVTQCLLPLYRDRQLIRDYCDIKFHLDPAYAHEPNVRPAVDLRILSDGFRPLPVTPAEHHFKLRPQGVNLVPEAWSLARLNDIISMAQKNGSQFILVAMPVTPALRSDFTPQAQKEFVALVKQIAAAHGVPCLNLYTDSEKTFPDEEFYDTTHLNRIGAEHLTRIVSREMLAGYFSLKSPLFPPGK